MRILSFIPAFLFAATSFVSAAPTSVPTDTSCVPSTGGSGSDASLQPVITILTDATTAIRPLNDKLTSMKGDSGSCTPDALSEIVTEIDVAVKTCITKLQATAHVSLDGMFLGNFCVALYGLLELLISVLGNLVACILILGSGALATIQDVVCGLLNDIISLVGCLKVYIVTSISGVLTPVLDLVCSAVDVCFSFFLGAAVSVH